MDISRFIGSIEVLPDTEYLVCVNDTTFYDERGGRYYTSTTKGLKVLYKAIGLYDNVFVKKLRAIDETYSDGLVNERISGLGSDDSHIISVVGGDLRVMGRERYDAFVHMLSEVAERYPDATASVSKDVLSIDGRPAYLEYNLVNNRLVSYSYDVIDGRFYGAEDISFTLDEEVALPEANRHMDDYYGRLIGIKVGWDVITDVILRWGLRSDEATKALIESPEDGSVTSPYVIGDALRFIDEAYEGDHGRLRACIEQSDWIFRAAFGVMDAGTGR